MHTYGGNIIKKSSIEDYIKLLKTKKSIVIAGHRESDTDVLWSMTFMDRLIQNINPEAEHYPVIDTLENLTWDAAALVKKYALDMIHINNINFKTKPDLLVLVDVQFGTNYELVPKNIDYNSIDISCWDHHDKGETKYISDFRDDSVNSTASIIVNNFIEKNQDGKLDFGHAKFLMDSEKLSTIGYQAVYVDTGLNENIMVEADRSAQKLFKRDADLIYLHNLNKRKITPATATIIAKAFEEGSRKNIGSLLTYSYIPWMKEGQGGELATVANDILRIDDSLSTSIAAGIVEESEDKPNFLKLSVRCGDPKRDYNAKKIARLFGGGGGRYMAGAQVSLGILKYSTSLPEFKELISEEIELTIMGSELNESGERPKKKTLEKPIDFEEVLNDDSIEGDLMFMIGNATQNYSLRGSNKYVTLFINGNCDSEKGTRQLGEKDISSLFEIEDLYLKKGEKTPKFKSCRTSVIYGLINDEVEPHVLALVSVKKNDVNNSLNSEDIAKNLFKGIEPEIYTRQINGFERTVIRVPLPFLKYTAQHKNLNKVIYTEMEERLGIVLGDKKDDNNNH